MPSLSAKAAIDGYPHARQLEPGGQSPTFMDWIWIGFAECCTGAVTVRASFEASLSFGLQY
jgi:hypothetical protein